MGTGTTAIDQQSHWKVLTYRLNRLNLTLDDWGWEVSLRTRLLLGIGIGDKRLAEVREAIA